MFEKENVINGPGTVVGANVKLTGILKDVNDITVHGHVDGEVISDKNIIISETATIKGPVTAEMVTISGKVNGAVTATKKLEITPTGKIYGSIQTGDLIIRSGAQFVGKSAMLSSEEKVLERKIVEPEQKVAKPVKKTGFWKAKPAKSPEPKYELE